MAKKTIADLTKELEVLKKELKDVKATKTENTKNTKTPDWEEVDRKVKMENKKPVSYTLVEKKGKEIRVTKGTYSKPIVKPRGEIKGKDAGWFKTTTKQFGKKRTAYLIPKKGVTFSKKEAQELSKLF